MNFLQQPWVHDYKSNRYTSTALKFGAITNIVPTLNRPKLAPLNQGNTTRCAEYAAVMNGKYIHGEDFSIDWQVSKVARLQGRGVDNYGSDPNAAMDSQTYSKRGGYLPVAAWDEMKAEALDRDAMDYSDSGYFKADAGKDVFDSLCIELQRYYNFNTKKGACVQMFTGWYDSFNSGEIREIGNLQGYHSYLLIDFNRNDANEANHYLWLQNSYGENVAYGGYYKMYRPLINKLLAKYGTSHKIPAPLTKGQIDQAKQTTALGEIERRVINLYYQVTLYFLQLYGKIH